MNETDVHVKKSSSKTKESVPYRSCPQKGFRILP